MTQPTGEQRQVVVRLRGAMADLVLAMAQVVDQHPELEMQVVAPCDQTTYALCPIAALVDHNHPAWVTVGARQ